MVAARDLLREGRFLLSQPLIGAILVFLAVLASGSVALGLRELESQQDTVARLLAADAAEREAVWANASDWGQVAYDSFFLAYDPPEPLAFAALGQRDVAPWLLRVRALALEGQIYESDQPNPELALLGRLDYAFVVAFLLPLFLFALLYDMTAAERSAGRFALLQATAVRGRRLWAARACVLVLAVLAAALVPFVVGAALVKVPAAKVAAAAAVVVAQTAVWAAVTLYFAFRPWRGPTIAATLTALWLVSTLALPLAAKLAIEQAVPSVSGTQISLEQREVVNDAWDLPKSATMDAFFATHPEWADTAPVTTPFHWKWYYAFQQVGDQSVAEKSAAYRDAVRRRERLTRIAAGLSPAVAVQLALQRLANTDAAASLAFDERVRRFHERLRRFWYPPVFNDEPFALERLRDAPVYAP